MKITLKTKRHTIFGIFILCIVFLATACQATPEQAAVVGKLQNTNDNSSNATHEDTGSDSQLFQILGAPDRWVLDKPSTSNNSHMTLNINAEVVLPETTEIPVVSADLRNFTQDDIDVVKNIFFGENAKYNEYSTETKENIEAHILSIKKELSTLDNSPENSSYRDQLNSRINELESEYISAPSESNLKEAEPILQNGFVVPGSEGGECEGFSVSTNKDGKRYIFEVANGWLGYLTYMSINDGDWAFTPTSGEPYNINTTKEDAAKQASELVSKITQDYELCYVGCAARQAKYSTDNWGWACVFMRSINGVPTAYASNEIGEDMEDTNAAPVKYEKIMVVVNDNGIVSFKWESPMTINSIENESANLVPFNEIEKLALDAINTDYMTQNEMYDDFTVDVTRIELGLMRIKQPNSGAYYYSPVWNIFSKITAAALPGEGVETFGEQKAYDDDGTPIRLDSGFTEVWGPVTLNAINGSRIDRNVGY
ncbi:hypothetical protein CE91St36_19630 [Christensenellaceae bacterium]|nr:hypothetical protein CE91St36_19630 [Christensenellaceae bacterium]BDF61812.1 hypothetical protein CE91St37_19620 [Christensenellaceae bacterium]